jgi:hypothetical protein
MPTDYRRTELPPVSNRLKTRINNQQSLCVVLIALEHGGTDMEWALEALQMLPYNNLTLSKNFPLLDHLAALIHKHLPGANTITSTLSAINNTGNNADLQNGVNHDHQQESHMDVVDKLPQEPLKEEQLSPEPQSHRNKKKRASTAAETNSKKPNTYSSTSASSNTSSGDHNQSDSILGMRKPDRQVASFVMEESVYYDIFHLHSSQRPPSFLQQAAIILRNLTFVPYNQQLIASHASCVSAFIKLLSHPPDNDHKLMALEALANIGMHLQLSDDTAELLPICTEVMFKHIEKDLMVLAAVELLAKLSNIKQNEPYLYRYLTDSKLFGRLGELITTACELSAEEDLIHEMALAALYNFSKLAGKSIKLALAQETSCIKGLVKVIWWYGGGGGGEKDEQGRWAAQTLLNLTSEPEVRPFVEHVEENLLQIAIGNNAASDIVANILYSLAS